MAKEADFEPHVDPIPGAYMQNEKGEIFSLGIPHASTPEAAQQLAIEYAEKGYPVFGLGGELQHRESGSGGLHFAGINWDIKQKPANDKSTRWVPSGSAWSNLRGNPSNN